MRQCIISDNSFFLLALQDDDVIQDGNVSTIHSRQLRSKCYLSTSVRDIFVVYISDVVERHRILSLLASPTSRCRIVLLYKMEASSGYDFQGPFPWLVSEKIGFSDLYTCLYKASKSIYDQRDFSEKELIVFRYLCEGYSVSQINKLEGFSEKHVYYLRQKTKRMFGLRGNNAAALSFYLDISKLNRRW